MFALPVGLQNQIDKVVKVSKPIEFKCKPTDDYSYSLSRGLYLDGKPLDVVNQTKIFRFCVYHKSQMKGCHGYRQTKG